MKILSIIAVLGIFIAFKFKGMYHKIISIGLTVSVLLLWTSNNYFITISFITVVLLTIATFVYGLTVKELNNFEKISIATMGVFLAISSIFKMQHLPLAGLIRLSMIVPIIITLVTFIKGKKITKEMSFMIFWLFYATLEFLKLFPIT